MNYIQKHHWLCSTCLRSFLWRSSAYVHNDIYRDHNILYIHKPIIVKT